ncbi:TPA: hypothetical protein ACPHY2_003720, partial [Legionella anisa]
KESHHPLSDFHDYILSKYSIFYIYCTYYDLNVNYLTKNHEAGGMKLKSSPLRSLLRKLATESEMRGDVE